MLRPVGDLNEYKYTLSDIIVSVTDSPDGYVILANSVREINITHNYSANIIPIIQVSANVEKELYKLLTSSEADISMTLTLYKYISNSSVKARELVFSKTFSVLNEYDIQPGEMKMLDTDKLDTASETIASIHTDQLVDASFYLIDKERLSNYRTVKSHFLAGASVTDLIALIFGERGFTTLLMNQIPDDVGGPKFLPAYNLISSLEFINNRYGIFNTPYVFYMDINDTYLLDKENLGKAIKPGSPGNVTMYLEEYATVESADSGSIIENDAYIVNIAKPPVFTKLDNYIGFVDGTKITSIDVDDSVQSLDGEFEKVIWVHNHKIAKQIQFTNNEAKRGVEVGLVNVDINLIAPNYKFSIIANNKYNTINPVKGDYRLNSAIIRLVKSDNANFGLAASLDLT